MEANEWTVEPQTDVVVAQRAPAGGQAVLHEQQEVLPPKKPVLMAPARGDRHEKDSKENHKRVEKGVSAPA